MPIGKKRKEALPPRGPPKNNSASAGGRAKTQPSMPIPSAAAYIASTEIDVKGWGGARPKTTKRAPYLNPDPFKRFIGPKNWGEAVIDGKPTTCLLDNGAQVNFVTPEFAVKRGLNVMFLDRLTEEAGSELPPINGLGGKFVKPSGFVLMNVRVPCLKSYDEDQIAIVLDDPGMKHCPVILGTPTLFRVMEVIKQDEINQLAIPWAASHISWLMQGLTAFVAETPFGDVANRVVTPALVDEVVQVTSKVQIPPFGTRSSMVHTGLLLQGCNMNVMTHGLERRSPQLPLGVKVLSTYATLTTGSDCIAVALRNTTNDWVQINKGVPVACMVAANHIPPLSDEITLIPVEARPTMTELERQTALLEKLDLSGLDRWEPDVAERARSLLREYHDIFSLEKHEIGKTKAVEHTITLKDPDTVPFKERFCWIPPPQVDEVREHLKLMPGCRSHPSQQQSLVQCCGVGQGRRMAP